MKTGLLIAVAGAGIIGLGAALHAWPLSDDTALSAVRGSLSHAGLTVTSAEGGHLTLLPVPRIDIAGVSIRDDRGDVAVKAGMLRASIRLASLLTGKPDVADVTLVEPDVTLSRELASDLVYRASGLTRPGASARLDDGGVLPELQRVTLVDGRASLRDGDGPARPLAERVNLVASRAAGGEITLSAALSMRGEPLQVTGSGLRFAAAATDQAGPLDLVVASSILSANLSGRTTGGANAQTDGELVLKTPSLEKLAVWLGWPAPLPVSGPVDVSGTVRLQPAMLSLSNAKIALASGRLDGVLALRQSGDHLALDGTVAADALDLTGALAPLVPPAGAGGWSRIPYPIDLLPRGDADLRISAGRLTVGRLVLGNAALSILARGGRVDAVLSNADFSRGSMKARLSLAPASRSGEVRPEGIDLKLAGSFDRIDLAAALGAMADQRRLSGLASGSFLVEGSGESPLALMRSLDGKAGASMRQGELVGVNVPDVVKRVDRRPLITTLDLAGGRTSIETGAVTARIGKGVVDVVEASLNSSTSRVVLAGQIGLGDRQLALSGTALAAGANGQEQVGLPFDIVGSFDDPQIVPDAIGLIRRSGADAPYRQPRPRTEAVGADAYAPLEPATP